ncbi:ABC transporter permease [Actinoplanes sp. ATCC 53533]|uniref:FtsX-like permease family protein n=1 Tax=Actinoplanes sp. ATCC 53533 TaxID=1288362 RepID=UPI001F2B98C2|nr:ABC transporter permease [Actinoplanes sp. ATCC 53533]
MFLARRGRAQWPLLTALLAVVMLGATLLGTCALLVTRTAGQSLEAAATRAAPGDVEVTAYTVAVRGPDARPVADDTRRLLSSVLAPFAATTAARASSAMRPLPVPRAGGDEVPAVSYLSGVEELSTRAELTAGRWPRAGGAPSPAAPSPTAPSPAAPPLEGVVLEPTARLLDLRLGARVRLGAEPDPAGATAPVDVTVVGIVRPLPGAGWERDPLGGAGYDLGYRDDRTSRPVHAYGPFLVDLTDLLGGGSAISRLEVTARPDLSRPGRRDLDTVAAAVRGADRRLAATLGERVSSERVASRLPQTFRSARDQQQVTAATVLAVAVLGVILTATALALGGRLIAGTRAVETALLSALGAGRRQRAAAAALEAGVITVVAAALAVPASSLLHSGLTGLPPLAGAGLTTGPVVTGLQVCAVAVSALALATLLAVLAVQSGAPAGGSRHRRELLARSGADLLLVAFAGVGWWQLRTQATGSDVRADAVRVLAPALLLTAGAALALRLVPPALRGADRLARRARGLALPLAAFEAARRPQAVATGLLVVLAGAAGTFGVAFDATWERSQHDQSTLSVGSDLALTLTVPAVAGQGASVAAATGGTVSPATDRAVVVGQWLGAAGEAPRLVAVDTTRAAALLRGRLDGGRSWAGVGAALAPPARTTGVAVPAGAAVVLTGTATGADPLTVTPRLLMEDTTGLRTTCTGVPVPLDGKAHRLPGCATAAGQRLVAVSLPIGADPGGAGSGYAEPGPPSRVAVTLTVPRAPGGPAPATTWTAPPPLLGSGLLGPAVAVADSPAGVRLSMTTDVQLVGSQDTVRTLIATAFPAPGPVPVAVSARFADELGAGRGSRLTLTVGNTPVPVTVAEVVPAVPSAPGAVAALADLDTLSRALVVNGGLESPVDAWWVGHPARADAAARATGLRLGTVSTRTAEAARLTAGPLRAGLPAALRLLVPAAVLLLIAGIVLHVACDLRARAVEVARLRGLGMTRREIRAVLLGQHVGVLLPLLTAGAIVGALATWFVAPLLVRSETGALPVPAALPRWPWAAEGGLLFVLLAGCVLTIAAVVTVQARRADAAHLRVNS